MSFARDSETPMSSKTSLPKVERPRIIVSHPMDVAI